MAAVAATPVAAIAAVMTVALLAIAQAVIAALVAATAVVTVVATPAASARLIAHPVHIRQRLPLMQHRVRLIVRQRIVHAMAKIALRQHPIVTPLRVVILLTAASAVLRRVKIARQPVTVLIVRPFLIAVTVVAIVRSVLAPVSAIRVRHGVAMIAQHHAANMLMQRQRNVVNSHRVSSVRIALVMMICRFSALRV